MSRPLLLDAAMGTRLIAQGLDLNEDDPCRWNLSHPEAVLQVHARDVAAGSQAILTNTFGANRVWLARYGEEGLTEKINRRAVELARQAAGVDGLVVGSIGPTASEQPGSYREQADALLEAGASALLFETHRIDQACVALAEIRRGTSLPLLVSLYTWPDSLQEPLEELEQLGADALGTNCEFGMDLALATATKLRSRTSLPLVVKPARSREGDDQGDLEAFSRCAASLCELGPVLVGGCCGTTEAHVAALRAAWYHDDRSAPRAGELLRGLP